MENLINSDLMAKIEIIFQGPNKDLLHRLVDILFKYEQYDEEPLSSEEEAMVQASLEAIRRQDKSRFISLEEYEKERGL